MHLADIPMGNLASKLKFITETAVVGIFKIAIRAFHLPILSFYTLHIYIYVIESQIVISLIFKGLFKQFKSLEQIFPISIL